MMRLRSFKQARLMLVLAGVLLPILAFAALRVSAAPVSIVVDSNADNTTGNGQCTLREAILAANAGGTAGDCGPFAIGATDWAEITFLTMPDTIQLQSELPAISVTVDIIGDLVGTGSGVTLTPATGTLNYGLRLINGAGGSHIEGLILDGFIVGVEVVGVPAGTIAGRIITSIGRGAGFGNALINNRTGILIRGASTDNVHIENNAIGLLDISPPTLGGNSQDGIRLEGGAQNIQIGTANIIGANGRYGIYVFGADNVTIFGNSIGRSPIAGNFAVGNGASGIRLDGGSNNISINNLNVIGSNVGNGILVGNVRNILIDNNFIGNVGGSAAPNGSAGIWIGNPNGGVVVSNNTIGRNRGDGVTVRSGNNHEITQNNIFNNGSLGIDLNNDNISLNDVGDLDTGANNTQNFPAISSAWVSGANLRVEGRFDSNGGNYRLELYSNTTCNPPTNSPLYGEGASFQQATTINTGTLSLNLPLGGFAAGDILTVLVIANNGDTSEFSRCVTILTSAPTPTPLPSNTPVPVVTTVAPVITTVAPVITTVAPVITTVAPVITTVAPVITTVAPVITTVAPVITTVAPVITTVAPVITTVAPVITTVAPVIITTQPPIIVTTAVPTVPSVTPDIDITKVSDGDDDVTIDIINNGDTTAPNVVVIEDLRDNVEYRAASSGQAVCVESAGLVTCQVGDIPAGATAQVNVNVDGNGADPASGQTTVIVGGVAVAMVDEPYIIKVGNPPVAAPGAEIVYTIRVINPTTESAFSMLIQDEMPEGIEIISGEATAGDLVIDGQHVALNLDELVAGGRVTITLVTRVSDAEVFPQIVNIACVTSSSNPAPRCAQMSFLRAGALPNTGISPLIYAILRWGFVLIMLVFIGWGLLLLRHRLGRKA